MGSTISRRLRIGAGLIAVACAGSGLDANAQIRNQQQQQPQQQQQAVPRLATPPDIVGIALGMAYPEAMTKLRAHNADFDLEEQRAPLFRGSEATYVVFVSASPRRPTAADAGRTTPSSGAAGMSQAFANRMMGGAPARPQTAPTGPQESLLLHFSAAEKPEDSRVLGVARQLSYPNAEGPTMDSLQAGLLEKYGRQATQSLMSDTFRTWTWMFNPGGHFLAERQISNSGCQLYGSWHMNITILDRPEIPNQASADCGTLVAASIKAASSSPSVATQLRTTIYASKEAYDAIMRQQTWHREAEQRRQRQELERAQQRAPTRL